MNPTAICGNCGFPYEAHKQDGKPFCYENTKGYIFTDQPIAEMLIDLFSTEQIQDATKRWQVANGHCDDPVTREQPDLFAGVDRLPVTTKGRNRETP